MGPSGGLCWLPVYGEEVWSWELTTPAALPFLQPYTHPLSTLGSTSLLGLFFQRASCESRYQFTNWCYSIHSIRLSALSLCVCSLEDNNINGVKSHLLELMLLRTALGLDYPIGGCTC